LDYPDLQIIVGNDRSEDDTKLKVEQFIKTNPTAKIKVVEIVGKYPNTMAKAAVLAEIAHHAEGEIYLITDADIAVPSTWAKGLIRHYNADNVGIVSGTTYINGVGLWGSLQSVDWIYFMCLVETFHRAGINTTAIGNNMSIRAKAYWETGGYENIPFSITEDYKIYQKTSALGWQAKNICNTDVLALSNPIIGYKNLLHQRKRWLMGAKELPKNWWFLFIVFSFYYPLSLVLFFIAPKVAIAFLIIKFFYQNVYILKGLKRLKLSIWNKLVYLVLYEPYLYTVTITTLLFFLLPFKTEWKGRKF
jgi:cellulose synthase/poly-beta-1,6-N-acetylglucosamine synthase-like glycosyltransferase